VQSWGERWDQIQSPREQIIDNNEQWILRQAFSKNGHYVKFSDKNIVGPYEKTPITKIEKEYQYGNPCLCVCT